MLIIFLEEKRKKMPEMMSTVERSRPSRGHHVRSQSETRPITETRLSSFDSTGEVDITAGNEWAMLDPEGGATAGAKKKVMVVIDHSRESRLAMLWALSHIVQRADTVSLIHVLQPAHKSSSNNNTNYPPNQDEESRGKLDSRPSELGLSLKMLGTSRRPEVEIEVMTVEGADKGPTIVSQAKKLEASILVLGQRKPSLFQRLFHRSNDAIVDYCIENAECLTLAVRKKSKKMGGYLINSRWQKNFWLLA